MDRPSSRVAVALSALLGGASAVRAEDPQPFLDVVRRYADTMIDRGRDAYGPQKGPLFLSALDRATLAPLDAIPPAPAGVRKGDRVGGNGVPLVGANAQLDENFLRVLYTLSEITGEPRYGRAADEEIDWLLRHTLSPETDLLAWGEHLFWDPMADQAHSEHEIPVHEFSRPWVLWDSAYRLAPEHAKRFALGLWRHQIADPATGAFDRHAPYWKHGPTDGLDFPRHGGFYIGTWAEAYAHTSDETFLKAIEAVLGRFERKRHAKTGFIPWRGRDRFADTRQTLSLAVDCAAAAERVPAPLAARLKSFVDREDEIFLGLPHDPKSKGFAYRIDRETGECGGWGAPTTAASAWDLAYGDTSPASTAMICVERYVQTTKGKYRDLVVAAADGYLASEPAAEADIWPQAYGHVISLELTAFRWTGKDAYLERARAAARRAVEVFWQDKALPRASTKTEHYETITGADTLALALLDLHALTRHLAVRVPANTIDR